MDTILPFRYYAEIMINNLQLKTPTVDDLQELYRWRIEDQGYENFSCRPIPKAPSFRKFKKMWKKRMKKNPQDTRLLWKDDQIVGRFLFFDYNPRNKSGEFGYYFPEEHRGKGYGTAGAGMFLEYLFSTLDLYKVYASTSANNTGSTKILEKYKFNLDGRNRDHYWIRSEKYDQMIYSLLKHEWETQKN